MRDCGQKPESRGIRQRKTQEMLALPIACQAPPDVEESVGGLPNQSAFE